jgi:hypothetical protein
MKMEFSIFKTSSYRIWRYNFKKRTALLMNVMMIMTMMTMTVSETMIILNLTHLTKVIN